MTQYNFGTGFLIGKRTDTANTKPFLFGALQDVTIDFDQKLEALVGQNKVAVALGDGELKITGKAKAARMQSTLMANLFFGATISTSSALDMVIPGETGTPASSTSSGYTVANSSQTPLADYGVFYTSSGIQLQPVASSSGLTAGQYVFTSSGASSGFYQFSSSDLGTSMTFYYTYSPSSGYNSINNFANPLMGTSPIFEIWFKNNTPSFGVNKVANIKLNACKSSKLSLPFSNQKWEIPDFDFQAFADASGNIFTITTTE